MILDLLAATGQEKNACFPISKVGAASPLPQNLVCQQIWSTSIVIVDVVLLIKHEGSLLCRQI